MPKPAPMAAVRNKNFLLEIWDRVKSIPACVANFLVMR